MGDAIAQHRHFLDIDFGGLEEAQKPPPTQPAWWAGFLCTFCQVLPLCCQISRHTGIFLRAMPSMIAQTIIRQLNAARKHVNLVSTLPNIVEQTLDGIGRPDIAVHRLRKLVKGQRLLFLLSHTPDRLGIVPTISGFESSLLRQSPLFVGLSPDAQ